MNIHISNLDVHAIGFSLSRRSDTKKAPSTINALLRAASLAHVINDERWCVTVCVCVCLCLKKMLNSEPGIGKVEHAQTHRARTHNSDTFLHLTSDACTANSSFFRRFFCCYRTSFFFRTRVCMCKNIIYELTLYRFSAPARKRSSLFISLLSLQRRLCSLPRTL